MAIPVRSAPVAPATSDNLFVVSTSSSVSKPNALSLFVCSINSLLVKGVTAPKSCNSCIISFVFSAESVNFFKLALWVSNSAVLKNINLAVPTTAKAARSGFNAPTKVPTPALAVFAALPVFLKDLLDLSKRPFNLFVLLLKAFVCSFTRCNGLIAF